MNTRTHLMLLARFQEAQNRTQTCQIKMPLFCPYVHVYVRISSVPYRVGPGADFPCPYVSKMPSVLTYLDTYRIRYVRCDSLFPSSTSSTVICSKCQSRTCRKRSPCNGKIQHCSLPFVPFKIYGHRRKNIRQTWVFVRRESNPRPLPGSFRLRYSRTGRPLRL